MHRRAAALITLAAIAVATAAVGTTSSGQSGTASASPAGALSATRVAAAVGHDTSAPLRGLSGHAMSEAEREAERDAEREADREHEDGAESARDAASTRDADLRVGDAPTRSGAKITEAQRERLRRRPRFVAPHASDTALQRATTSRFAVRPRMPAANVSFDGIDVVASGCGCLPPDTNGEVGPNDFVQTVNAAIAVYSKTGTLRAGFPKPINALWSDFTAGPECRDNNDGDPVVLYDQLADRWVVTQFALPGFWTGTGLNYECIAVSTTGDPTGSWYRYQFPYTSGLLNDYPKFGVWPTAYVATFNNFSTTTGEFAGAGVVAYDRTAMLSGASASLVQVNLPASTNEGSLLPADLDGTTLPPTGAPVPLVEMQDSTFGFASDRIMLRRLTVNFAAPNSTVLSAATVLENAAFDPNLCNFSGPCIPQPGAPTGEWLDPISDRLMFRASYRNFGARDSLLINGTVDATGADLAGIRWSEIQGATTTSPVLVQQGTYAPDSTHRWMGSIAQDRSGNIALGFSASSNTLSPSLRYTGRLVGDPLGQMTQGESTLVTGSGRQTSSSARWGDYSDLTIDPVDDCTFWYTGEYVASVGSSTGTPNWRTRIGSFTFPSCNNTTLPTLTVGDVSVTEGNSGTKTVSVPITLSAASTTPVTVNFASANQTASAGSDYVARSTSKTIAAGTTSATVVFTINGDTTPEPNETFAVNFSGAVGAEIGDSQAVVTILNDDAPPTLTVSDASIAEGNSGTRTITFTVTASAKSSSAITYMFTTTNGTATAGSDYVARNVARTLGAGKLSMPVTVTVKGDKIREADETFFVTISSVVGATIADGQGVGTIRNDD